MWGFDNGGDKKGLLAIGRTQSSYKWVEMTVFLLRTGKSGRPKLGSSCRKHKRRMGETNAAIGIRI
jgi:hypothetical protein